MIKMSDKPIRLSSILIQALANAASSGAGPDLVGLKSALNSEALLM
jgi:hypothetical protein